MTATADPTVEGEVHEPERVGALSSFRHRNFSLFFAGQLVTQSGSWMRVTAQTLLLVEMGGSGVAVGGLVAAQFAGILLLGPWAGAYADRVDKRRLLIAVRLVGLVPSLVLVVVSGRLDATGAVPLLFAAAAFGGVVHAFDFPARQAFIAELVPRAQLTNAVALNGVLTTGARIAGPAAAGLVVTLWGFPTVFALELASAAPVLLALVLVDPTRLHRSIPTGRRKGQLREGLRYAWERPELRTTLAVMAVVGVFVLNFQVLVPLLVTDAVGGSPVEYTRLLAVISVGSVPAAVWNARRRYARLHDVAVSAVLAGAATALLGCMPNLALMYPIGVLVGYACMAFTVASSAVVQLHASDEMRGRLLALQAVLFIGSGPIGGPFVGGLSDMSSPRVAAVVAGALATLAGAWVLSRGVAHG